MRKTDLLKSKLEKKKAQLLELTEKTKTLRGEILQIEKEIQVAEEAELLAYMREFHISPAAAKDFLNKLNKQGTESEV